LTLKIALIRNFNEEALEAVIPNMPKVCCLTMNAIAPQPTSGSAKFEIPLKLADRVDQFTGREWLLVPILECAEHRAERFLIIAGEPGAGESAFAARLAGTGRLPENELGAASCDACATSGMPLISATPTWG
jgi:hypothetical protein